MDNITNEIVLYVNGIILVVIKYFAFNSLFEPAVKRKWMFLSYGAFLFATTQVFLHLENPWSTLATNILASAALTFLFKGNISTKLIFAVLIYLAGILSEGIALLLISLLHYSQYGASVAIEDILFLVRSVANSIHLPLIFALILIFRKFIHKKAKYKHFKIPVKYTASILALLFGIILINALFLITVLENIQNLVVPIILSNIISTGLILLIVWLYNAILNHLEAFEQSRLKDQMLERWEVQYQTAITSQKMISELTHNLKFRLIALLNFLNNEKYTEAKEQLEIDLGNFDITITTGNISLDTILNYYSQKIEEDLSISLSTDLLVPPNLKLDPTLIAIILGNALDNAIDATQLTPNDKRYIHFKAMATPKNELIITITNKFTVMPVKDKQGNFVTTKKDPYGHGIGLLSSYERLSKKVGYIHTEYTNDTFHFVLHLYQI